MSNFIQYVKLIYLYIKMAQNIFSVLFKHSFANMSGQVNSHFWLIYWYIVCLELAFTGTQSVDTKYNCLSVWSRCVEMNMKTNSMPSAFISLSLSLSLSSVSKSTRIRSLDSVVTSLPTDQEVPGSIPGSWFSNGELFDYMYGLIMSVFQIPLSIFCSAFSSDEVPVPCWSKVRGGSPISSMFL